MRADRKAAKAREVCDFTVPAEHRSAAAVSSTDRSSK
jgi:hypothetical protein